MFKDFKLQLWISIALLSLLANPALSFDIATPVNLAANTYIIERIVPFDIPANDLKVAVEKQLSRDDFLTDHFTTEHVAVTKLVYKATYNGSGRIVDPPYQSFKHIVTKDSVDVIVTYHAVVHPKQPTRKAFNGTTSLKIYLNYTKEIDFGTEMTKIEGVKMYVDPSSFHMTYSVKPTPSEKKLLDFINNGSLDSKGNTTIYYLLQNQQFSSNITLSYFLQNLVNQKLSPTYNSSYNYQYESLNATFNLTTVKLENIERGVAHYMNGGIKNFNNPYTLDLSTPIRTLTQIDWRVKGDSDFHTLFTLEFIKNFISYNIDQNKDWKGYYIDMIRYKTPHFGFKLVDLQYIVNDFTPKYAKYYLNDILFTCDPSAITSITNAQPQNKLKLDLKWKCKCNLLGLTPQPTILDFDVTISQLLAVGINGNTLSIYIEESKLKAWQFREVDGIKVVDQQIAAIHINSYLRNVLGFAVGSNFRIKEGSKQAVFSQTEGLWIG